MPKRKNLYFIIGLIIFYVLLFLSPAKLIYFGSYFIATFFFYLATRNITLSLLYALILALFTDVGLAKSLFILEPENYNLGVGWSISPLTIFILCLLPFSLLKRIKTIYKADKIIILFFFWSLVSFVIFPYNNVLWGVLSLGEAIVGYYLLRTLLVKIDDSHISYILISMLIFQSMLGIMQFFLHQPFGSFVESVTYTHPYGVSTVEAPELFRISGTFEHPNHFASFLLATIPFLFLFPENNVMIRIFKFISPIILFFTYSRAAWVIFILIILLMLVTKLIRFKIPKTVPLWWYSIPIAFTIIFIILTPYFNMRLNSLPQAFEEWGSFGVREKLIQEGISLVTQYPIEGVGLYRSIEEYANNPVTDLFERIPVGRSYGIHNTPLEIAAEIGIPGLLFFILFLLYVFRHYLKSKKTYLKNAAFFGLLGLLGISMFNPFFHTSQFRILFLLSAIILA